MNANDVESRRETILEYMDIRRSPEFGSAYHSPFDSNAMGVD